MSPSSLTRVFLTCCLLTTTLYSEIRITSKTITPTPTQTTLIINTFRGSVMLFTHANINHVTDMLSMFHNASDGSLSEKASAQLKEINNRLSNNAMTDIIVVEIVKGKPADIKKATTRYDLLTNGIGVLAQHPAKNSADIDISYMVILPATVYSGTAIISDGQVVPLSPLINLLPRSGNNFPFTVDLNVHDRELDSLTI